MKFIVRLFCYAAVKKAIAHVLSATHIRNSTLIRQSTLMDQLSHIDDEGRVKMVDTSDKATTTRHAVASARVLMSPKLWTAVQDHRTPKGDPLEAARLAGIMAAKRTAELIPLCHPLPLTHVDVQAKIEDYGVYLESSVSTNAQTGVEMEALTAVSVAALTIYDMCKALDKGIMISDVRLERKTGGKSGDFSGKLSALCDLHVLSKKTSEAYRPGYRLPLRRCKPLLMSGIRCGLENGTRISSRLWSVDEDLRTEIEMKLGISHDARPQARLLLAAAAISIVLWFIPFAEILTYPFRIFVTFIHEGGHAIAALLTGNSVESLSIATNASGETYTTQGGLFSQMFVSSAGYVGSMAYGALLLILIRKSIAARVVLIGSAAIVLALTLIYGVFKPVISGVAWSAFPSRCWRERC